MSESKEESVTTCPRDALERRAKKHNLDITSWKFAKFLDSRDPLKGFRERFSYPHKATIPEFDAECCSPDEECVYLCGNSLGLKPKILDEHVQHQLSIWADMGVYMHFHGQLPAALCDQYGKEAAGRLVGAKPECVTHMNGLTINLNLLLISFYQPKKERYKIVIEKQAFPSDRYAVRSQAAIRGLDPEKAVVELEPRKGEKLLRTEDICKYLENEGPSIAVICLSGVQYYTAQKFDMKTITASAQKQGCIVGWDLAHAIGNVEIKLDEWNVDFACWCTYKYLNSGPGCIAGAYVNSRHAKRDVPNIKGWWSSTKQSRFEMKDHCEDAEGIEAFRVSNPPPLLVACLIPNLEIFDEAGMDRILKKQFLLTGYLEYLLDVHIKKNGKSLFEVITPRDPNQRGAQLSLEFSTNLKETHNQLKRNGIVCDIRLPNVMRIAPVPLYNSFEDVYKFVHILNQILSQLKIK